MKHKTLVILILLFLAFFSNSAFAQISFAVLPIEGKGGVSEGDKEAVESSLYQNLIESGKYKIIERSRIRQILEEQAFQTSDWTDPSTVAGIGKITGVDKLITGTIYKKSNYGFAINFSVVDVATAKVEFSKERTSEGYPAYVLGRLCAAEIILGYPLLGKILGKTGDVFIVNLGKDNELSVGDRLFVARKEVLLGDKGEILFQKYFRVGTLEVTALDAERAQTKVRSLQDQGGLFKKDDLVSPEPIPKKEPLVSMTPLLPDTAKGELLLEDDMQKKKYLSAMNNKGKTYIGGKLHLNATHLGSSQKGNYAHCLYPPPFDQLKDFILEWEIEFKGTSRKVNVFVIAFKCSDEGYYQMWVNNVGQYKVDVVIQDVYFNIVPGQSTPSLKRGAVKNKFRIAAYGSKFDVYVNDKFLVGFEHELYEKGTIGFKSLAGNHFTVDNVKVWEAVKKQ